MEADTALCVNAISRLYRVLSLCFFSTTNKKKGNYNLMEPKTVATIYQY